MKNWIWIVVVIVVATALGADNAKKPKGVFSMLKVGQAVTVRDELARLCHFSVAN